MAAIDAGWYVAVVGFARHTSWLHTPALIYTDAGLAIFAVLLAAGWWTARRGAPEVMARALWSPVSVLLAWGLSNLAKVLFREPRPCRVIHGLVTLAPCEFATDYSFPSNHAVVAAAAAVALLLVHRRLGMVAVALAVLMGLSRIYIGAHYPHDVLAGLVLGAVVSVGGFPAGRLLAGRVRSARAGGGRWTAALGPSPEAEIRRYCHPGATATRTRARRAAAA
jgi:undecaprenyl-diphosphatase